MKAIKIILSDFFNLFFPQGKEWNWFQIGIGIMVVMIFFVIIIICKN